MNEDNNNKLDTIEKTLIDIHKILKPTNWQLFIRGLWYAFGYIIGLMIAVALIGWFLNVIGFIPYLTQFSEEMRTTLNIVKTTK